MILTFVDPNGNEGSVESALSIQEMLTLRHEENMPWYSFRQPETTIAGRAGLSYGKMETLRRSQTWREEATAFIAATDRLELTDATLKALGCMDAARKPQPQKGNRSGRKNGNVMSKSQCTEFGELVIQRFVESVHLKIQEDKMVTFDWAIESLEVVMDAFNASYAELPPLPDKPKAQTQAEKNAAMQDEIADLKAQVAALKKANGERRDL